MGAWAFQGVLNVGVQIVLIVFSGWCFARFRLLTAEQFMGQINVLLLRVAFPMLNIYLMGIKVDLRDAEAWRSLGGYMMWVTLVQAGILLYVWCCNGRTIGDAGLLNLVLTANNTVIVGLPVMEATFPEMGGRLSLLTAFVLFLQVIPFSITAFEVEKWMVEDHRRRSAAADTVSEPPSTPDRELSGRWVVGELAPLTTMPGCNGGGGGAAAASAAAIETNGDGEVAAAEPPTPRASGGSADAGGGGRGSGSGRLYRRRSLSRSNGGGGPATLSVRARLGRRRVGSGVVVGTVSRGWAPATPQDSPTASPETSVRLEANDGDGRRQAAAAVLPPLPYTLGTPSPPVRREVSGCSSSGDSRCGGSSPNGATHQLQQHPSLARGLGLGVATEAPLTGVERPDERGSAAALAASATAASPRGSLSPPPSPSLQVLPQGPVSAARACLDCALGAPSPGGVIKYDSVGCIGDGGGVAGSGRDMKDDAAAAAAAAAAVVSPSAARSYHTSAAASSSGHVPDAAITFSSFAFRHPLSVVAAAAGTATAASEGSASAFLETSPPQSHPSFRSNGLRTAVTAPPLTFPVLPASSVGLTMAQASAAATGAVEGGPAHGRHRPAAAAALDCKSGRSRQPPNCLPNSRTSADCCGASAGVGSIDGRIGRRLTGTGGGASVIQRQSLPAHWPPAGVDGVPPLAVAAVATATASPPSPSPLRPSRGLLSPLALACPDLPVPQAISLVRVTSSALPSSTQVRVSDNGYKRCRTTYDSLISVDNGGGGDDYSTRISVGRHLPAVAAPPPPPLPAVSVSVALPAAAAAAATPLPLPDRALAREATGSMTRHHGGLVPALGRWLQMRLAQYSRAWSITWIILKNPLLWSLLVALVINLSGLRSVLWPGSSHYRPELGWVVGALSWTSSITVPVSLFSNGVWLYGKTFGRTTLMKAGGLLVLKLVILGPMQLACAAACRLEAAAAMSLLLLALCPVASTSFVIASQYGHGADVVTAITMLGIVLLVPVVLVALALPRAFGLYDYRVA